jgi:hydrogenase maturation protease
VGLGNPLAGDDGVGWHIARRVRLRPETGQRWDALCTMDLLRLADELENRPALVLVDALLDARAPPGSLRRVGDLGALEERGGSAHHLPPVQAILLLRTVRPSLRDVPVTWLGVTIQDVSVGPSLSDALAGALDAAVDRVCALLADIAGGREVAIRDRAGGGPPADRPVAQ